MPSRETRHIFSRQENRGFYRRLLLAQMPGMFQTPENQRDFLEIETRQEHTQGQKDNFSIEKKRLLGCPVMGTSDRKRQKGMHGENKRSRYFWNSGDL